MLKKGFFISILFASFCVSSSVLAVTEEQLFDALKAKKHLFAGEISPVSTNTKNFLWSFTAGDKQYQINTWTPATCYWSFYYSWDDFVTTLRIEDKTFSIVSTPATGEKGPRKFTGWQNVFLRGVKTHNFIDITMFFEDEVRATFLDGRGDDFRTQLRDKKIIDYLLFFLWDEDYRVKAAASFALGLLSKEEKLEQYVYRIWSEAIDAEGYTYRSKPMFSSHCSSFIRQLGIYQMVKERKRLKKGFVIATCLPESTSRSVFRRTMTEEFFIVSGEGEFWLKDNEKEVGPFSVLPGDYIENPNHMHVQFRNTDDQPLKMIVTTNPPFDNVVKKFPEDEVKEIHESIGCFKTEWLAQRHEKIENHMNDLLQGDGGKEKLSQLVMNEDAPFLQRLYGIKFLHACDDTHSKVIEMAKHIVVNKSENWALRANVIRLVATHKPLEFMQFLKTVRMESCGHVRKIIDDVL